MKAFFQKHETVLACILLICGIAIFSCAAYVGSQEPSFRFSRENFGLALFKGGFRGWTLHWCDGYSTINGKWIAVRVDKHGSFIGYGYRIVPTYTHYDLRGYLERMRPVASVPIPIEAGQGIAIQETRRGTVTNGNYAATNLLVFTATTPVTNAISVRLTRKDILRALFGK